MTKNEKIQEKLEEIKSKVAEKGFFPTKSGYFRTSETNEHGSKSFVVKEINDHSWFVRKVKLSEFVKNLDSEGLNYKKCENKTSSKSGENDPKTWELSKSSQAPDFENPLISMGLPMGSSTTMGRPESRLTPTQKQELCCSNKNVLPALSSFGDFESLKILRSDKESLLIGFDAEWFSEPRYILSWQFSVVYDVYLYEYVVLNTNDKLLSLDFAISKILSDLNYKAYNYNDYVKHVACVGFDGNGDPKWQKFDSRGNGELISNSNIIHPLFKDATGAWEPGRNTIDEADDLKEINKFDNRKPSERGWKWSKLRAFFPKETKKSVSIVCHTGKVDLSTLFVKDEFSNYLRYTSEIQGGAISLQPVSRRLKCYDRGYVNNNYVFNVSLNFRDTMGHAPAGKKKLSDLGDAVKINKIASDDIDKSRMDKLLIDKPSLFFEYASRDSTVTVLYASSLYGYNKEMPVTLTSATANVMRESMKKYLGCEDNEKFNLVYRGLEKVVKGKVKNPVSVGYIENRNMEPVTELARDIQMYASESYHGGYNGSFEIGWFTGLTNDFDLQNAYPTAMMLVPDIDWNDPVKTELRREYLTKKHWVDQRFGGYNPMLPVVARIKFKFPKVVKYPCIPVNVEGRLIYPLTSDGMDVVYASGPEIFLALQMGAEIWCEMGWVLNSMYLENGNESRSLGSAVLDLVRDRRTAQDKYGKKCLEELTLKTMVNSGYGKNAQNVIDKHSWSAFKEAMEALGDSAITNPVSATLTTSFVRAVLLATMNEAHERGYHVYSVTTDGFIADIPNVEKLEEFELYKFENAMRFSRNSLTGGEDLCIWEIKHSQNELLNLTTRGNMAPNVGGVCAHNSTRTPYESGSVDDRLWFIDKCLSRDGRVEYEMQEWTKFKDLARGKNFSSRDVVKHVSMDFDMKRKPIRDSFYTVDVCIGSKNYQISNFDTEPFKTVEEARLYKSKKDLCSVLLNESDWELFWFKIDNKNVGKQVRKQDGVEWSKLTSCVMGHRKGLWTIDCLNVGTVQEKCDWLNSLELTPKNFKPSDWKNARRAERQVNMLSYGDIADFLEIMGAHHFWRDRKYPSKEEKE